MLRLDGFDGVSSRDAPGFASSYDNGSDSWLSRDPTGMWLPLVFEIFGGIWKGLGTLWRKLKTKCLRAKILPEFPNTLICPQCFTVVKKPVGWSTDSPGTTD
jgi:hypothetical protein